MNFQQSEKYKGVVRLGQPAHDVRSGFTLVELMVASFLFLLMSTMLVAMIRSVMDTWEYTEGQNLIHAEARKIFDYFQEDFAAIYTQSAPMVIDLDDRGRPRLCLVKRLLPEIQYPVFRDAGNKTVKEGYRDEYYFSHGVQKLRASGGLAEVVYLFSGADGKLWRGFKSPVGGGNSLFSGGNLGSLDKVESVCHLVSSRVLYLGIKCWTPLSTTWDETAAPATGGPSLLWDSTGQCVPQFFLHGKFAPECPVFPSKVRIELILGGAHTPSALLSGPLDSAQKTIELKNTRHFYQPLPGETAMAKVGDEWISYQICEGNRLSGVTRGMLRTTATSHAAGTMVSGGLRFGITIALPR